MRKIVYIDIYTILKKDGSPASLNVSRETSYQSDMLSILSDFLEGSRKEKAEYFVAFLGLKYYTTIIINFLYKMGYNLLANCAKNDLHVKDYRLRQTPNGQTYYIQIKTAKNGYVTFQGVDGVIGLKQLPENKEDALKAMSLYHYTRSTFLADCKNSETRLLFSSASISKTMFGRENPDYLGSLKYFKKLSLYVDKKETKKKPVNVFLENFCRPGVHGGFCYLTHLGEQYHGPGIVVDNNSLYPFIASSGLIPMPSLEAHGYGTRGIREYIERPERYYVIMKVTVTATLKDNGLPCISTDGDHNIGRPHYLNNMKKRTLTLTPSDRRLLFSNYNITYYSVQEFIVFPCRRGLFKKYVEPKYEVKRTAAKGSIERDFIKLLINGFIGFFARDIYTTEYDYQMKGDYIMPVKVMKPDAEIAKEVRNVSGACFINMAIVSQAKEMMVNIIKKHQDRFLYTDTDSIHLKGTQIPHDITISDKMGDFKVEHVFTDCCYKRQKNYLLVEDGHIIQCIAGTPKDILDHQQEYPRIDYRYINNAIKHLHIGALYNKPVLSYTIEKDISTGDIFYSFYPTLLCRDYKKHKIHEKTPKEIHQEKNDEWIDNNIIMPKIWKHYDQKKREHAEYKVKVKRVYAMLDLIKSGLLSGDSPWIPDLEPWQKTMLDELTFENGILFY